MHWLNWLSLKTPTILRREAVHSTFFYSSTRSIYHLSWRLIHSACSCNYGTFMTPMSDPLKCVCVCLCRSYEYMIYSKSPRPDPEQIISPSHTIHLTFDFKDQKTAKRYSAILSTAGPMAVPEWPGHPLPKLSLSPWLHQHPRLFETLISIGQQRYPLL